MTSGAWPTLELAIWAPTKRSLHLYAQMLGKLRLALAPHQPNFLFTSLALTARGFTTGVVPWGPFSLQASLDVFAAELIVERSDGQRRAIALTPDRTIARVFGELHGVLRELGVDLTLSPIPQEVADTTPLDRDERPAVFEPLDAQRWFAAMTAVNGVFDRWRSHFFGRTGIQLWWGAFDFALLLFSGRHVEAPRDRGYLLRYDLDAEMLNAGFWPGDDANPASFYGYVYPPPPGSGNIAIAVPGAVWSAALGEWILPYETVRGAGDPAALLTAFLDAIYAVCVERSGWDRAALSYAKPPLRRAP